MGDKLYKAGKSYEKMLNTKYKIVLGRKGKSYTVELDFQMSCFYHLVGLKHLDDIEILQGNKERIFKDIMAKDIKYEDIIKSLHFNDKELHMEDRITYLTHLEEMLDNGKVIFLINKNTYKQITTIKADYLVEYRLDADTTLYLFLVKQENCRSKCTICSFFKKYEKDYTKGTAITQLLLCEKMVFDNNKKLIKKVEIYKNPCYKEEKVE